LGRWMWRALPRDLSELTEVSFLINSMSLWKFSAVRRIGDYRTDLGVDHVDTDYCLRAQALGYRLMLNPAVKFLHPIGARRQYRFFGKTFQAGGHSPARRKSIARNTVLLVRQYGWRYPSFALLCISRLAYEALGIVMAESDKARKLGALLAGMFAGLIAKISTSQDTSPRPQ
jgi:rhamnosyltransferase